MDNLETNTEPVGAEGATSSQDNSSAMETQPAETDQVVSANESAETGSTENPWDSDPRFKGKTPEEMFNIVQEADKYKGVLSQKAHVLELLERQTGLPVDQLAQMLQEQENQRLQQEYAENPSLYLEQKVTEMEAKLATKEVQSEINEFVKNNEAYAPFKDKLEKLALTEGIGFTAYGVEVPIETLAKEYFGQAIASGQESAYKKIETKKQTQSSGTSTTTNSKLGYDQLKDLPRAERIRTFEQLLG